MDRRLQSRRFYGIDDDLGHEIWGDVAHLTTWVTLAEHDALLACGIIDLDGMVIAKLNADCGNGDDD